MTFDIDSYRRTATPVAYGDLDYAAFANRPLSAGALRCLGYMCDIESHTICYLRDLLVTPSHPKVTTFLTMWAYEEYWHGEALASVLDAHGIATGDGHIRAVRTRLGWRDRLAPIRQALAANLVGTDFVAVHMTFGAINKRRPTPGTPGCGAGEPPGTHRAARPDHATGDPACRALRHPGAGPAGPVRARPAADPVRVASVLGPGGRERHAPGGDASPVAFPARRRGGPAAARPDRREDREVARPRGLRLMAGAAAGYGIA